MKIWGVLQTMFLSIGAYPSAKDYMEWHNGGQPLVDASFIALGLLRCPWVWEHLDEATP